MSESQKDMRQAFWSRPGTFGIVGSFESEKTLSWRILAQCQKDGIPVAPVNAEVAEVLGIKSVASPDQIADLAGIVCVRLDPHATASVEQAAALGVPVWLSQRTGSESARAAATRTGAEVIDGSCPLMYLPGIDSYHTFHRFMAKTFGAF